MESICCVELHVHTSIFSEVSTVTPVALGSMMKCIFVQPIYQRDLTKKSTRDFSNRCKKITLSKHHADPHNPQPTEPSFFSIKEGLLFSLIDHPAHPIGRGGSNQRELLASPDSPSPCASLATLLLPVGRAGEAQRQSRRNAGGAKSG